MGFPLPWLQFSGVTLWVKNGSTVFIMHSQDDTSSGSDGDQVILFLVANTHLRRHAQQGCKSWMWTCKYPFTLFWADLRSPKSRGAPASQVTSHDMFDSSSLTCMWGMRESMHTCMGLFDFSFHHSFDWVCVCDKTSVSEKCIEEKASWPRAECVLGDALFSLKTLPRPHVLYTRTSPDKNNP